MSISKEEALLKFHISDPISDPRWDPFISQHPDGKIYHSSAWCQVIDQTYCYRPCGVIVEREGDGHFVGVLPLFYIDNWLIDKRLISSPFTTYSVRSYPRTP